MTSTIKRVFDLETDGLLEEVTKIHTLVIKDLTTGQQWSCANTPEAWKLGYLKLEEGFKALEEADVLYGHNIITYDAPVLRKLYPKLVLKAVLKDTFVIAASVFNNIKDVDYRVREFPKQLAGRHSLKAWGWRLGRKKIEYTEWCKQNGIENPWEKWRPEMQTYGEGDVETNVALVRYLGQHGVPAEQAETELELRQFLFEMETNGWPFDMEKAIALQGTLAARREQLTEELKTVFGSWQVSTGIFTPKKDNKKAGYQKGVPIERFKTVVFNPGSRQHIANRLITLFGWEPEEYTESGEVKVDETTLNGLPYPPVPLLVEYLTIDKRLGQLAEGKEAWLKHIRPHPVTKMQHIHGRINQSGTITHRAAHSKPNLGQVPKVGSPYGGECRALFRVPEGWVQIGVDASGLQARCLGHFAARYDGGTYSKMLLEGDVHTANRIAFELPEGKEYRDRSKTGYYAWLFGCGDEKLGKTLYPDAKASEWPKIGKRMKAGLLKASPGLKYLVAKVQPMVKKPGYVTGLDGRRIYLRSEHAALNTLIQGAEAVIMKRWLILVAREMRARYGAPAWKGKWTPLGWIHDELQVAVRPEIAEEVMTLCVQTLEGLTEHFKFRCPLTGEAKRGMNWQDTH
ncbi:DNA polymerase [Caudoviricetes sp.]|nr:DNA polymerase [Caudoviricetes sp.]